MTLPAYHILSILFYYHNTGYRSWAGNDVGYDPRSTTHSGRTNIYVLSCKCPYGQLCKSLPISTKTDAWIFLRGLVVFYYCATAPRLRSYLAQTVAKFDIIVGVLLWPNQVRPLHDNMSSYFHVVFTNHAVIGWLLHVCETSMKITTLYYIIL